MEKIKKILLICFAIWILFLHVSYAYYLHRITKVQKIDDYTAIVHFVEHTTNRRGNFVPGMECRIYPNVETEREVDIITKCTITFTPISRPKGLN